MEIINNITAQDFKDFFKREFKYLVEWNAETVYYKNQEVYYNNVFYTSLINNNLNNQPDLNPQQWEETEDDYNSFITDEDIEKAFVEAKGNFNYILFADNEKLLTHCFLLVTANYLLMDLAMSGNDNGRFTAFIVTSKTVGSVSASYGIPEKFLKNPIFAPFIGSVFGFKYLSFLIPKLAGHIHVVRGTTLPF